MLHSIFLTILFYLTTSLVSSTPTRFPPKGDGFTASLIPPISPRSPFYPQILAANNIPTTLTNVTLDRTHYDKWVETKRNNMSQNDYSDVSYNKNAISYVMDLYIGDPEQLVYGIFDTGSDLVWFQCESQAGKGELAYYNQSKSNTYKVVDCKNETACQINKGDLRCSRIPGDTSCVYFKAYLDGVYSRGVMSSDVITFKPDWEVLQDFVFGCSNDNPLDMPGVIGASNSFYSMPKQIYPDNPKFSYCISGLTTKTNFVSFGSDAKLLGRTVNVFRHPIDQSYFMDVTGVQVNEVDIKVDPSVFALSRDGKTGFTIDSGYDITSLSKVAFDALKDSLYQILGTATMHADFEICYPHSTFVWPFKMRPKIGIKFPGWVLELDVWRQMGNTGLECLQVHRTPPPDMNLSVLGAQQLFDVNVGHDLKNNLLYLQPMKCPTAE